MKKLSEIALEKSYIVIEAIKQHPFNKELAEGTLDIKKFAYYIEQDTIYLRDFARSLATIASKAPTKYIKDFLVFSEGALVAEQEVVHNFFRDMYNLKETGNITSATLAYTSFLLQATSRCPLEVGIASILPCFWVYNMVGDSIVENTKISSENPYKKWIETYSGKEFADGVKRAIYIFDDVAKQASDEVKEQMVDTFYKSTVLEWYFWNDSYNLAIFDKVL